MRPRHRDRLRPDDRHDGPAPTLLTFNAKDDCCFAAPHALPPLLDAARPIFALYGKEPNLRSHVNHDPGTHNYQVDNRQALYRMLGDHFFPGDKATTPRKSPARRRSRRPRSWKSRCPPDNLSLHSLALSLSRSLPRDDDFPKDKDAARGRRDDRRARLRSLLHARTFDAEAEKVGSDEHEGLKVTYWRLRLGNTWSVPVVELVLGETKSTALMIADEGRKSLADRVKSALGRGERVLVVDPFYVGESKPADHDYLWALMLATVGDRPLGLQAGELAAVARWGKAGGRDRPLSLVSRGRRTSVMALAAAALEDSAIDEVNAVEPLGSLKELIEAKTSYTAAPELFCFGLLQEFDVRQLAALSAPRKVAFETPSDRARRELAGLKGWYATWGIDGDPFP